MDARDCSENPVKATCIMHNTYIQPKEPHSYPPTTSLADARDCSETPRTGEEKPPGAIPNRYSTDKSRIRIHGLLPSLALEIAVKFSRGLVPNPVIDGTALKMQDGRPITSLSAYKERFRDGSGQLGYPKGSSYSPSLRIARSSSMHSVISSEPVRLVRSKI